MPPRRSKREMRMGEILAIGQEWAPAGELRVWTVRQVHRLDCQVVLESDADRKPVSFDDLRKYWEPRDHTLMEAA